MNNLQDQIWAYLHDELSPEKRDRFEQALTDDPALREALAERRATHELLEQAGQEPLEAELLAEWEAEHPEFREAPKRSRGRIIRFSLPLAAAAAAAILLIALPQDPIRWQRTSYGAAPQLRGASGAPAHYRRGELKPAARELQEAIEQRIDPTLSWKLQLHLQELAGGALAVEISGHPRSAPDSPETWSWNFQSLDDFRETIPAMAQQVASDLVP